jgi:hypothetical protein
MIPYISDSHYKKIVLEIDFSKYEIDYIVGELLYSEHQIKARKVNLKKYYGLISRTLDRCFVVYDARTFCVLLKDSF